MENLIEGHGDMQKKKEKELEIAFANHGAGGKANLYHGRRTLSILNFFFASKSNLWNPGSWLVIVKK